MSKLKIGHKVWAIAEGYIPASDSDSQAELVSHETVCILNPGKKDAQVELTIYLADHKPIGPYKIIVQAQRTKHVRLNDLTQPQPVPRNTDYSCLIESDRRVVVQHTRFDTRQPGNVLFSTMPLAAD